MDQIINTETLGRLSAEIVTIAALNSENVVLVFHLTEGFKGAYPPEAVPHYEQEQPLLSLRGGSIEMEEAAKLVNATARRFEQYRKYPQPRLFEQAVSEGETK